MHSKAFVTREGRNGGTYACKELVYAYAMWISAKFHLAVIRAFDALVSGQAPALPADAPITETPGAPPVRHHRRNRPFHTVIAATQGIGFVFSWRLWGMEFRYRAA